MRRSHAGAANARYAAACLTLLLMALAPVATFAFVYAETSRVGGAAIQQTQVAITGANVAANDARLNAERALAQDAATPAMDEGDALAGASALNLLRGWVDARLPVLLAICVWLWAAGVLVLLVRFGGGWMRIRRLRRRATTLAPARWQAIMRVRAGRVGRAVFCAAVSIRAR
jgi:hypothetical protein